VQGAAAWRQLQECRTRMLHDAASEPSTVRALFGRRVLALVLKRVVSNAGVPLLAQTVAALLTNEVRLYRNLKTWLTYPEFASEQQQAAADGTLPRQEGLAEGLTRLTLGSS